MAQVFLSLSYVPKSDKSVRISGKISLVFSYAAPWCTERQPRLSIISYGTPILWGFSDLPSADLYSHFYTFTWSQKHHLAQNCKLGWLPVLLQEAVMKGNHPFNSQMIWYRVHHMGAMELDLLICGRILLPLVKWQVDGRWDLTPCVLIEAFQIK